MSKIHDTSKGGENTCALLSLFNLTIGIKFQSSPVEAQKRKRRREQNRVAARRCRERKKEQRQVLVGVSAQVPLRLTNL